jgi:prepilin-type N-terminal cleavage/methylation domain-containing protein
MNHTKQHRADRGFTLVELSIVLVIIALLIGGILGGQELIHASRLQSTIKSAQDIREAFHIFRDKYGDWPGDMPDARKYWQTSCVDLPDASTNPCNGDGDGTLVGMSWRSERYRAWQHLSLARIIPGNYTGALGNEGQPNNVIGENVYGSPFDGFYMLVGWHQSYGGNNNQIDMFSNESTANYALKAADAKFIDQKVDDGIAYKGRVYGIQDTWNDSAHGCPFWSSTSPHDYNVARNQLECRIRFNWIDQHAEN